MSKAAYDRGSEVIARGYEYRYTAHDIAVAKRTIDRENHRLANVVEKQAAELEQLRTLIAELEPLRIQVASLTVKLEEAERIARNNEDTRRQAVNGMLAAVTAHEKLSGIVKLAMTPEQYHYWREMYEAV